MNQKKSTLKKAGDKIAKGVGYTTLFLALVIIALLISGGIKVKFERKANPENP